MDYHIGRESQQLGQFPEEEIRTGLASGRFRLTDLAWTEGMSSWTPLGSLAQFKTVAPQPSIPPTPGPGPVETPSVMPTGQQVPLSQFDVLPPANVSTSSSLAVASLICGIASLPMLFCCSFFTLALGPAAIICGHMALSEIRAKPYLAGSRGIAKAGLILGYVSIGLLVMLFGVGMIMGILHK